MNLLETISSLEENHIQIALDVGSHGYCGIDSNCPLAIELRKIIKGSGITLEQLIKGFADSQEKPPDPLSNPILPEIDGKTSIRIGGTVIPVDLTAIIGTEYKLALEDKMGELVYRERKLQDLGRDLYNTYLYQIAEAKKTKTLPQLDFPLARLQETGCMVTTTGNRYLFHFPAVYNPQWLVHNGYRYKLSDKDIETIKNDILVRLAVTKEGKIIEVMTIRRNGKGFQHYHGTGEGNCWGHVKIPPKWDGILKSLNNIVIQLMGALATINYDSLMTREPDTMPQATLILERSTKLGKEGKIDKVEEVVAEEGSTDTAAPRRWGNGRERRAGNTPPENGVAETPEERLNRRFGDNRRGSMELVCADCGEIYGHHFGQLPDIICPRDWDARRREETGATLPPLTGNETRDELMMRRFGTLDVHEDATGDFELIMCADCGRPYGEHHGTDCPER